MINAALKSIEEISVLRTLSYLRFLVYKYFNTTAYYLFTVIYIQVNIPKFHDIKFCI
jgi:hypothetical protein